MLLRLSNKDSTEWNNFRCKHLFWYNLKILSSVGRTDERVDKPPRSGFRVPENLGRVGSVSHRLRVVKYLGIKIYL